MHRYLINAYVHQKVDVMASNPPKLSWQGSGLAIRRRGVKWISTDKDHWHLALKKDYH